jgi:hypothetical protein
MIPLLGKDPFFYEPIAYSYGKGLVVVIIGRRVKILGKIIPAVMHEGAFEPFYDLPLITVTILAHSPPVNNKLE